MKYLRKKPCIFWEDAFWINKWTNFGWLSSHGKSTVKHATTISSFEFKSGPLILKLMIGRWFFPFLFLPKNKRPSSGSTFKSIFGGALFIIPFSLSFIWDVFFWHTRHGTYRKYFESIKSVGLLAGGGQGTAGASTGTAPEGSWHFPRLLLSFFDPQKPL